MLQLKPPTISAYIHRQTRGKAPAIKKSQDKCKNLQHTRFNLPNLQHEHASESLPETFDQHELQQFSPILLCHCDHFQICKNWELKRTDEYQDLPF
ncbi:hypothetical protein M758_8G103800 [Ceratodon purpureus]|nr:hypothetical protein M758_8G103800 [Ceratodon purpureus]